MVICALVASHICERNGEPREYFPPSVPLVTLIDLGDVWVHFELREDLVRTPKIGRPLEGMIAAQLLAAHNAAMECHRRAMLAEQTFEGRREGLNQANKFVPTGAESLFPIARALSDARERRYSFSAPSSERPTGGLPWLRPIATSVFSDTSRS